MVGYPDEGYYDTCWIAGLWSVQAKVEGIVVKTAWHGGTDCSVVNDPVGDRAAPHCIRPSVHVGLRGWCTNVLLVFVGGLLKWGL